MGWDLMAISSLSSPTSAPLTAARARPPQGAAGVVGQTVMVQPQTLFAPGAQTGPAMLPSAHVVDTVLGPGVGHFSGGQVPVETGTQAHTDGELSNWLPWTHSTF